MDPRLDTVARREGFNARVLEAVRRLPGVEGAALAAMLPAGVAAARPWAVTLSAADGPSFANVAPPRITAAYAAVSAGFFQTLNLPLLRGHDFRPADVDGQPLVAVVSQSAAAQLWPGQDPLGARVTFNRGPTMTVVGVSADPDVLPAESTRNQAANFAFVPLTQWIERPQTGGRGVPSLLLFRSPAPEAAIDAVQAVAHGLDEDVALLRLATLDRAHFEWYGPQRAIRLLMSVVSALALGIALLGVYGVITYFVTARTREFGIRRALGATPGRLLRLVVDHAVHIVLKWGSLAGVFVASVTTRLIEHEVFATMPNGLATWVVVPILVLTTGVLAGVIPARRAATVDPNVSLRES